MGGAPSDPDRKTASGVESNAYCRNSPMQKTASFMTTARDVAKGFPEIRHVPLFGARNDAAGRELKWVSTDSTRMSVLRPDLIARIFSALRSR
jgi:hypothetical protein